MKSLPYWLRFILACLVFGGLNFAYNYWKGWPFQEALFESIIVTLIWGICMSFLLIRKKTH